MLSPGCHWAFWALSDPCCEVAELRGDSWPGDCWLDVCVSANDSVTA